MSNVQEVFGPAEALATNPLAGGPVELPLLELPRLYRLLWWADDSTRPGLEVVLPEGATLDGVSWRDADDAEPEWDGRRVRVAWPETGAKWGDLDRLERLGILLKDLPAGAEVQLVGWGGHEFTRQRFSGRTTASGVWAIEAATIGVPAEVLRRALAMSEACEVADFVEADTEELAALAAERAAAEWGIVTEITAEGRRLCAREDGETARSMLVLSTASLFLLTFREHWPLQEFLDEDEEDDDGLSGTLAQLGQTLGQALARSQGAPAAGALVWKGQHGDWLEGNLAGLPFVAPEDVAWVDREMQALGFRVLGDLTGTSIPGTILRGYGHPQGFCFGSAQGSSSGEFLYEFVSAFADGTSLTTSTMPGLQDEPKRKSVKRSHVDATPVELFRLHEAEAARLQAEGRTLRESEPALAGLARAVDEFLGKLKGR